MHKEYILLNGFRKAKKGFTAGFHVPLNIGHVVILDYPLDGSNRAKCLPCARAYSVFKFITILCGANSDQVKFHEQFPHHVKHMS